MDDSFRIEVVDPDPQSRATGFVYFDQAIFHLKQL